MPNILYINLQATASVKPSITKDLSCMALVACLFVELRFGV